MHGNKSVWQRKKEKNDSHIVVYALYALNGNDNEQLTDIPTFFVCSLTRAHTHSYANVYHSLYSDFSV